jgi:hypothetical protein
VSLHVQLPLICSGLLADAFHLHLFFEVIAFCRELLKVAPASLQPYCYFWSAEAMILLLKLDEAEELIHEGLAVGLQIPRVSKGPGIRKARREPVSWCFDSFPSALRRKSCSSKIAFERGDWEVALDIVQKMTLGEREKCVTSPGDVSKLLHGLRAEADVLEQLDRLDEAMVLDAEWRDLNPGRGCPEAFVRSAKSHMTEGNDVEAEKLLRAALSAERKDWHFLQSRKTVESSFYRETVLAELLERKGTEEALAEARTLRDGVAQELAQHEAKRAAALDETRAAAAEALRQWREERSKAKEERLIHQGKGKKKSKKKGKRRGKAKSKRPSSVAAIEGEPPREPAEGMSEASAGVVEGAAASVDAQEAHVGDSQPPEEKGEEKREECAICLQDLEIEDDDEDPWGDEGGEGERLVVLRCGHRFHEICGDMWCAKCAVS